MVEFMVQNPVSGCSFYLGCHFRQLSYRPNVGLAVYIHYVDKNGRRREDRRRKTDGKKCSKDSSLAEAFSRYSKTAEEKLPKRRWFLEKPRTGISKLAILRKHRKRVQEDGLPRWHVQEAMGQSQIAEQTYRQFRFRRGTQSQDGPRLHGRKRQREKQPEAKKVPGVRFAGRDPKRVLRIAC